MKKLMLSAAMLLATACTFAQVNVQLHYDLGRNINDQLPTRQKVTSTVEMFKADKLGNTFFFIDFDYYSDGVGSAYGEFSREFTVKELTSSSVAAHIEYDGGLNVGSKFQPAALVGPAWNWHNADFSTTFSLQALFKQFFKQDGCKAVSGAQFTAVWGTTFADGLCTFSGFADFWYGYIPKFDNAGQKKGWVFLSEPQFWINVIGRDRQGEKLSIGTEWELSNNFCWATGDQSFFFNPTIAVKWAF